MLAPTEFSRFTDIFIPIALTQWINCIDQLSTANEDEK